MGEIGWISGNLGRNCTVVLKARQAFFGRLRRAALLVIVGWFLVGAPVTAQLSGQFGLDLVARRIPTTETDEIKLNTPSEFAELEFGIVSNLDLKVRSGFTDFTVDGATNMAGPEHLILAGVMKGKDFQAYGIKLDELSLAPELWFAVPFEAVLDVNNLPNAVVIPPADPLFVALRLAASWSRAGWSAKQLLMFQDTSFPKPGSSFAPLSYPVQSQSFGWGSLTYLTWQAPVSTSVSVVMGLSASQAPTSVKGYSAVGSVEPGSLFLTLSVAGLSLGDLGSGPYALHDAQIGLSGTLTPTQTPSASLSFSARLSDQARLSTSLKLFGPGPQLGAVTVSISFSPFQAAIALDKFDVTGLSASAGTSLSLGSMTGNVTASATGLERGLTGLALGLMLSQGLFSAGTNVAFAQRATGFGFASLTTHLAFRFSPGTISIEATFGRYGLTRAALSTGVVF
jgi:hypothetical protein